MKLISWILLPPLVALTIYLAVANRHMVLFSLDPFDPAQPALAIEAPLFLIVLAAVFLGMVLGGLAAWRGQRGWRRSAREKEAALRRVTQSSGASVPTKLG